jgi:glycosyltransferase involved in cell wall biosynthesis
MKNKKRLHVAHIITNLGRGGAEAMLVDLVLNMHGYTSTVFYFYPGAHLARLQQAGIPTYQIAGPLCRYDPVFAWRLYRLVGKIQPDCLHVSLWSASVFGTLIGRLRNIPVVCAVHLSATNERTNTHSYFRALIDALIFRLPANIVAVSDQVGHTLTVQYPWAHAKIQVVKNGIDTQQVIKASQAGLVSRATLGIPADAFVIGCVGRFNRRKNQQLLLDVVAARHHPLLYVVLVGHGPDYERLQAHAHALGITNQIIFVLDQPAYGYYPLFDCFALPSLAEGLSIALLEAMTLQRACVVAGGMTHEVITHGKNGLLVNSGNNGVDEFIKAITYLQDNPAVAADLGKRAQQDVLTHFSVQRMVDQYEEVFSRTIFFAIK